MTHINGKDLEAKLKEYFLQQEKDIICEALSLALIDLMRYAHYPTLDILQRVSLDLRTRRHVDELMRFLKEGDGAPMTIKKINSSE